MSKDLQSRAMSVALKSIAGFFPGGHLVSIALDEIEKINSDEALDEFKVKIESAIKVIEIPVYQVVKVVDNKVQLDYQPTEDGNILYFPKGGLPQHAKDVDGNDVDFEVHCGKVTFLNDHSKDSSGVMIYHRKHDAHPLTDPRK